MKSVKKRKNLLKLNFNIIFIFFLFSCSLFAYGFEIKKYYVEIYLLKNSKVQVTETLKVNFIAPKRGIIRFIPYRYKSGIFNNNIRIKFLSVQLSNDGENFTEVNYKVFRKKRNIYLRIGKRSKFLQGIKTYKIVYLVENVIKHYKNKDEFYWNVIGTNWNVPIEKANLTVFYPKINPELLRVRIWYGRFGENKEFNDFTVEEEDLYLNREIYLPPKNGLTIGIAFPGGFFQNISLFKRFVWFLIDNFGLFIPILALIIMLILWWYEGRDEKKGVLVVQYYPPDDMTPAEAGTLIDEKVDLRDVVATILSLADKGYLKIIKKDKEILFKKLKDKIDELKPHEKIIFNGIFIGKDEISLEDLKKSFFATIEGFSNYLYDLLTNKKKLFNENPEKVRGIYKKAAFNIIGIGILALFYGLIYYRWDIGVGLIISGIIVYIFSKNMPKKSHKGAIAYNKLLGFKEFMEKVEKPVLEKLIKEDENYFSKTLPYAIAFNLEKDWVKKFDGIEFKLPDWYVYSGIDSYTPLIFYSFLARDLSHIHRTLSTIPSGESSFKNIDITGGDFDFGGFSGGGFGGGGGGTW